MKHTDTNSWIARNDLSWDGQFRRRILEADKCRPSGKARSLPKRPTRRHCSAPFQLLFAPKTNTPDIGKAVLHITVTRVLIIYFSASRKYQIPHALQTQKYSRLRSLDYLFRIYSRFFLSYLNAEMAHKYFLSRTLSK